MSANRVYEIMKNHYETTGRVTGLISPDYWPEVREMSAEDVESGVVAFSRYLDGKREGVAG